jgi:hypothetical protein
MRAGLSFSYPPISLLLRQPLSIKKSYAGAIQCGNCDKKRSVLHLLFIIRKFRCEFKIGKLL